MKSAGRFERQATLWNPPGPLPSLDIWVPRRAQCVRNELRFGSLEVFGRRVRRTAEPLGDIGVGDFPGRVIVAQLQRRCDGSPLAFAEGRRRGRRCIRENLDLVDLNLDSPGGTASTIDCNMSAGPTMRNRTVPSR